MDSLKRRIVNLLEILYYNPYRVARSRRNIHVDAGAVLLKSTRFRIRDRRNTIRIGRDTMVGCHFIFESGAGEIAIGERCFINSGTRIISRSAVEIGNEVIIAWDCTIYDHNSHSLNWRERAEDITQQLSDFRASRDFIQNKNWGNVLCRPIKIRDKAWIGFGSAILNGVTIGEGAVVGACTVVREDVEPWTVVVGNPAQVVKKLK